MYYFIQFQNNTRYSYCSIEVLVLCDIAVVPKLTLSEHEIALVLIYSYTLSSNTTLSQKAL